MKQLLFIICSLALFTSCEKEIDLNLADKSGTIVIEGNITDQPGPYYVKITKSIAFTENNQYPAIEDAIVTISDNTGQTETLQYIGSGLYKTNTLVSEPGNTYTLNVIAGGIKYSAQSTMPQPVNLDDLKQDSFVVGSHTNYSVLPMFTDPQAFGNRYVFEVSVNDSKKKTFEVFSDNENNGMVNQRSIFIHPDHDDDIKVGDTIHVEMQCADQNIYTYYSALIQISDNGGLGGNITPANPPSNLNNGALGYFSAHTSSSKSIVIQ